MTEEWEQRDHKGSEGLGKDIKAWRRRQKTPHNKLHPMAPPWEYPFVPPVMSTSNLSGTTSTWTFENSTDTTSLRNGYQGRKASTWLWKIGTRWWKPPQNSTRLFKGFTAPYRENRMITDWRIGCLEQNIVYVVGRLDNTITDKKKYRCLRLFYY